MTTADTELLALAALVNHEAALLYAGARQYGEQQFAPDEAIRGELRRRMLDRMRPDAPVGCSRCEHVQENHNVACFLCDCVGYVP